LECTLALTIHTITENHLTDATSGGVKLGTVHAALAITHCTLTATLGDCGGTWVLFSQVTFNAASRVREHRRRRLHGRTPVC
jgi:hypothetical protein